MPNGSLKLGQPKLIPGASAPCAVAPYLVAVFVMLRPFTGYFFFSHRNPLTVDCSPLQAPCSQLAVLLAVKRTWNIAQAWLSFAQEWLMW